MSAVTLSRWTEGQFAAGRDAWQGLLETSGADALFMGWDWQWRWWMHHRELLGADLVVFAAADSNGALVGLLPFYAQRTRARGFIPIRRLQLLGGAWRDSQPAFSEYLDFIVSPPHVPAVLDALAATLLGPEQWDELLLPHVLPDSLAARFAVERLGKKATVRSVDPMTAHRLQLADGFQAYVRGLSSGTRRRLLNQRQKGVAEPALAGDPETVDQALQTLRSFKQTRWQSGPHSQAFLAFHRDFAAAMAKLGALRLTCLEIGGRTASVLYDVRVGSTEYYLESGFDPALARGITPGYLHLGYAIEKACADGLQHFDLLGGAGRHRDYKRDLCPADTTLFCYQVIRNPLLRTLYFAHRLLEKFKTGRRRSH